MSMIESILNNTPDRHIVEAQERFQVRVVKATIGWSKGQPETDEQKARPKRLMLSLTVVIVGDPLAYPINDNLVFPLSSDTDDIQLLFQERIKDTIIGLGWNKNKNGDIPDLKPNAPTAELPLWKGLEGWIVTGVETYMGKEKNTISRWISTNELVDKG